MVSSKYDVSDIAGSGDECLIILGLGLLLTKNAEEKFVVEALILIVFDGEIA